MSSTEVSIDEQIQETLLEEGSILSFYPADIIEKEVDNLQISEVNNLIL